MDELAADDAIAVILDSSRRLERLERRLTWGVIADWSSKEGTGNPELFAALAGLQKPAWGHFHGALQVFLKVWRARPEGRGAPRGVSINLLGGSADSILAWLGCKPGVDLVEAVESLGVGLDRKWKRPRTILESFEGCLTFRNAFQHDDDPRITESSGRRAALLQVITNHLEEATAALPNLQEPFVIDAWTISALSVDGGARYVPVPGKEAAGTTPPSVDIDTWRSIIARLLGESIDLNKLRRFAPPSDDGQFQVRLHDFRVGPVVGSGAFAFVHRAHDDLLGRQVALKVLREDLGDGQDEARERFLREARLLAEAGKHPHVVEIYGFDQSRARKVAKGEPELPAAWAGLRAWIALEWIEGSTLEAVYQRRDEGWPAVDEGLDRVQEGEPTLQRWIEWWRQAADGLAYLHGKHIVHRDLKPQNIMVDQLGNIRILDLGVARQMLVSDRLTQSGQAVGTAAYMAPEQLNGTAVGEAADVYSLGQTFYELITGRRAFQTDGFSSLVSQKDSLPVAPQRHVKGLPSEIALLLQACMDPVPARRPTASSVRDDLARTQRHEPIECRAIPDLRRLQLFVRRHRAAATVFGMAVVLLALASSLYALSLRTKNLALEEEFFKTRVHFARLQLEEAWRAPPASQVAALASVLKVVAKVDRERPPGDFGASDEVRLLRQVGRAAMTGVEVGALTSSLGGPWAVLGDVAAATSAVLVCRSSPSGELLAAGHGDGSVRLWRMDSRLDAATVASQSATVWVAGAKAIRDLAFSLDGQELFTGSGDGVARVWSLSGSAPALVMELPKERGDVWAVAFGPAGDLFTAASAEARRWSRSGQLLRTFSGPRENIYCLAVSPAGDGVLAGSTDGTLRLWTLDDNGRPGGALARAQAGNVEGCTFLPGGREVVSASNQRVRLWSVLGDPRRPELCQRWEAGPGPEAFMSISISSDGQLLAASCMDPDGTAMVWELPTGREVLRVRHGAPAESCTLTSDGSSLATAGNDGLIRLWRVERALSMNRFPWPCDDVVWSDSNGLIVGTRAPSIERLNLTTGTSEVLWCDETKGSLARVRSVATVGRELRVGLSDGRLVSGQSIVQASSRSIEALEVTPAGALPLEDAAATPLAALDAWPRRRIVVGAGVTACVTSEGDVVVRGKAPSSAWYIRAEAAAVGSDRRMPLDFVPMSDGMVVAWSSLGHKGPSRVERQETPRDTRPGTPTPRWTVDVGGALSVLAIGRDERLVAVGLTSGTIERREAEGGRLLGTFEGHRSAISGLAVSSDGDRLASCGLDGTVRTWPLSLTVGPRRPSPHGQVGSWGSVHPRSDRPEPWDVAPVGTVGSPCFRVTVGDFDRNGADDAVISQPEPHGGRQSGLVLGGDPPRIGTPLPAGRSTESVSVSGAATAGIDSGVRLLMIDKGQNELVEFLGRTDPPGLVLNAHWPCGANAKAVVARPLDDEPGLDYVVAGFDDDPGSGKSATFISSNGTVATLCVGGAQHAVAAGDLDRDGREDLVFALFFGDAVIVGLNRGRDPGVARPGPPHFDMVRHRLESKRRLGVTTRPWQVGVHDIDRDGNLDVVLVELPGFLTLLRGNGHGDLGFPVSMCLTIDGAIELGAVVGAERLDVVAVETGALLLFAGQGDGSFVGPSFLASVPEGSILAIGNFDGHSSPRSAEILCVDDRTGSVQLVRRN